MNGKIIQLIDDAVSLDSEKRGHALFVLDIMFERNRKTTISFEPTTSLEEELWSLELNVSEQAEIVERLVRKAESGFMGPSIPAVIGSAAPQASLGPLLYLIESCWDTFDDQVRWQLLVALRDQLVYGKDERPLPDLLAKVRKHNPMRRIEAAVVSADMQLAQIARKLIPLTTLYLSGRKR